MPNDHYVPQTYLEQFTDPDIGGKLHAYSKRTSNAFQPNPKKICCERSGDHNPAYLKDANLLGDFRAIHEPRLRTEIDAIEAKNASASDKLTVAMFMASLMTCTPALRRVGTTISNCMSEGLLRFGKATHSKYFTSTNFLVETVELLERGEIKLRTDADYIRAVATKGLMPTALALYQENWTIGLNGTGVPFVTSDNPLAIDYVGTFPAGILFRHLPLNLKVSVTVPHSGRYPPVQDPHAIRQVLEKPLVSDLRYVNLQSTAVERINRLIIQCAEDHVFSSTASDSVAKSVKQHAHHRLDVEYIEQSNGTDIVQGAILAIKEAPP